MPHLSKNAPRRKMKKHKQTFYVKGKDKHNKHEGTINE